MEFEAIQWLRPTGLGAEEAPAGRKMAEIPFADVFQAAVDNVRETDAEKNEMEYLLATGQLDNPAELMISLTEASLSVDLLVQMRNKALDSYNSIMQMAI